MKRFGKKLGVLIAATALLVMSAFSVSAASAAEDQIAADFINKPLRSAANFTGDVKIVWYSNNGYCLNAYTSGIPTSQTNVSIYSNLPNEPTQNWEIRGQYNQTTVRVFLSGYELCLDCSPSYNTQLYASSGAGVNVNDQYLKMVDETNSLPHLASRNPTGFVLTKSISSTPRAMHADQSAPLQMGWNVNYAVPSSSYPNVQATFYWLIDD